MRSESVYTFGMLGITTDRPFLLLQSITSFPTSDVSYRDYRLPTMRITHLPEKRPVGRGPRWIVIMTQRRTQKRRRRRRRNPV
jgi:hypothetical protein